MGRKTLQVITIILSLSALLTGCAFSRTAEKAAEEKTVVTSIYPNDRPMWNYIFSQKPQPPLEKVPGGMILPHHMIVAEELSRTYQRLALTIQPKLIVLISPNHYQNAGPNIQTCLTCEFQTIDGIQPLNTKLTKKLIKDEIATDEPSTFIKEHGIHAHTPFIRHFFPQTTILPITLKWETTEEEIITLTNWLNKNTPPQADTLVISSVDFSHYVRLEHANFHDVASYTTIKNFNYENVPDLEIDSPPSISAITHLMELRGYQDVQRLAHTNNQDFHTKPLEETTSHQFISFSKGQKQVEKTVTIMATGAISEQAKTNDDGSRLSFYDNYRWSINWDNDSTKAESTALNPYLRDIRRKEDRLLVGSDFLIFNLDIPINTCIRQTQNEMNISFCRLDKEKIPPIEQSDHIYVSLESDTFSTRQQATFTKSLIDQGATIVIGRTHNKPSQKPSPIERYKNGIIISSLGDFITNNSKPNSSGNILEMTLTPSTIDAKLYPIDIIKGYPRLKSAT